MMTTFFARVPVADVPEGFEDAVRHFSECLSERIDEYEALLTKTRSLSTARRKSGHLRGRSHSLGRDRAVLAAPPE